MYQRTYYRAPTSMRDAVQYRSLNGRDFMSKWLIIAGVLLVAVGLLWPLLTQLGLGQLPGDIRVERKGFSFYFPITTCIIISLVISGIIWLFRR
jgi:hypothetical protein